jgi:hypothetical protein
MFLTKSIQLIEYVIKFSNSQMSLCWNKSTLLPPHLQGFMAATSMMRGGLLTGTQT